MKHELYMKRTLELASLGKGQVSPNPMVGCVIVYNDQVIAEGWHKQFGGPHAEVDAIQKVKDPSVLKDSTCYVNLEPCSHFGKTPPCADLLIHHQVKRVVIANDDPNPKVNGQGIRKLRDAGIEVIKGVLAKEGRELNKRFFASIEQQRPYVILKWAESADGYVCHKNGSPVSISRELASIQTHKWRSEEDAILVGSSTILNDDPSLTTRNWPGRNPVRVVWDPFRKTKASSRVYDESVRTIVFGGPEILPEAIEKVSTEGNETNLKLLTRTLHQKGLGSVLVEGGPRLHSFLIKEGLYDEIRIVKSKGLILNEGMEAVSVPAGLIAAEALDLKHDIIRIFSR